ncbi:unnamed protein product [Ectocarpus sp. CCAP 1310/34]|nr:unnamed protein product [Ectocarpus sp. CCAP 1310/34]
MEGGASGSAGAAAAECSHVHCARGGRTGSAVVQPLVDQLVRADPKIAGPAIKRTLKTVGFTVSDRQSQRAKKRISTASKEDEAGAISRLPSLPFRRDRARLPGFGRHRRG